MHLALFCSSKNAHIFVRSRLKSTGKSITCIGYSSQSIDWQLFSRLNRLSQSTVRQFSRSYAQRLTPGTRFGAWGSAVSFIAGPGSARKTVSSTFWVENHTPHDSAITEKFRKQVCVVSVLAVWHRPTTLCLIKTPPTFLAVTWTNIFWFQ